MANFAQRLAFAIDSKHSVVCVGLDPVMENLPQEVKARHHEPLRAIAEFCKGVIDATNEHCAILKPQAACFERFGSRGVAVLEEVCEHAKKRGQMILLDAKRGDIGISANHYAASAVHLGVDAITLSGYLGPSTIEPYLEAGLGVFVLVRTSNPDSDVVQSLSLRDGRTVAEAMADIVTSLAAKGDAGTGASGSSSISNVGCVVGATKSADAVALRRRMPHQMFLIPGYGAQGGTATDIAQMTRRGAKTLSEKGVLVNASRSVIYAKAGAGESWLGAVGRACVAMNVELNAVIAK
ncbi:MAG: orotidine-5'-phosphate decarboxylase [Phycisphaerales bacterium]